MSDKEVLLHLLYDNLKEIEKEYKDYEIDKRVGKIIASIKNEIKEIKKLKDDDMGIGVRIKRKYINRASVNKTLQKLREEKSKRKKKITKEIIQVYEDNNPKINVRSKPHIRKEKPEILLMTDVKDWAWWIKSQYIKKYLSDEFDFDIISLLDRSSFNVNKYDLYFTFGWSYINNLRNVDFNKRVSGVTAHRSMKIFKQYFRNVRYAHANSILLYNELKQVHDNVFYVPNGVDEERFYPKKELCRNNKVVFGHVGKLSPHKGQKTYIEPSVNGYNYFSHYNIHDNKIPFDKMVDVHQNYDVFIVASDEDGTPNPALEAAACGRPIISNRIGNMPEFIKDGYNGFLVEKNISDYREKIKWCNDNPEKVKEMGENARKTVEESWTWEMMSENYRKMFKKILGRK